MPFTADPTTIQRLQLARHEYHSALRDLAQGSETGAWAAVLSLHDAVETFFICLGDVVGLPQSDARAFHQWPPHLDEQLRTLTPKGQLHKKILQPTIVKQLNSVRVPVKHFALYPRAETVRAVAVAVGDFLESNCLEHFGFPFSAVSRAALIKHPKAKAQLQLAEAAFDAEELPQAADHAAIALASFLNDLRRRLPMTYYQRCKRLPEELIDRQDRDLIARLVPIHGSLIVQHVNEVWREAIQRLELELLGINPLEKAAFERLTPIVHIMSGGNHSISHRGTPELVCTRENVAFCLRFVFDTIWRLESIPWVYGSETPRKVRAVRSVESYLSRESGLQPAGLVAKGTVIPKALYALGRKDLERIWMWTKDDGVEVMADFDAFEVEDVLAEA